MSINERLLRRGRAERRITSRIANGSQLNRAFVQLSELAKRCPARVTAIREAHPDDVIAQRLRDLGFVPEETIEIVARAPFGGDPILVRIGGTRFALRRSEAARIAVETLEDMPT